MTAVIVATAAPILLAVRPISMNEDLGYHLALGDSFLSTGKIADICPYIYTNDPAYLYKPGTREGGRSVQQYMTETYPPGPGCWFDQKGGYHFVMASWISQAAMSLVNKFSGFTGLSVLSLVLVAGVIVQILILMRRLGMPAGFQAVAMILIALTAYERFNLRPELFGYNLFLAQLLILVFALGLSGEPKKTISWRAVAAIAGIQLVFTNVHANSSLGFGPSLAFLADAALRYFWRRSARHGEKEELATAKSNLLRLAILLGLQICVTFVNPWPWRLAVLLPYEQLALFRTLKYEGFVYNPNAHPWSTIGEHFPPFSMKLFGAAKSTYALMAVMGLSGLAAIFSLAGRHWRMLFILLGMMAATMSLRRQIAVGAFILAPIGLYAIWLGFGSIAQRFKLSDFKLARKVGLVSIAILAAVICWSTVNNRFYLSEDLALRFGLGTSRFMMPMDSIEWLNKNQPAGRLWTDFNISSNMYYLTSPRRDVPITTNGWAYPPEVMRLVLNYTQGYRPFEQAIAEYDLNVVALHTYLGTLKLMRKLRADPDWTVVYVGVQDVIFVRNKGPNAELAKKCGLTESTFNVRSYLAGLSDFDKYPDYVTRAGATTLYHLGWFTAAIEAGEETLRIDPSRHDTCHLVGASYAMRGTRKMIEGGLLEKKDRSAASALFRQGGDDMKKAKEYFEKALEIKPGFADAINDLAFLDSQLAAIAKGMPVLVPSNFDNFPPEVDPNRNPPGGIRWNK